MNRCEKRLRIAIVTISTGPNAPDAVLTDNTQVAPQFKFNAKETSIKFNNGKSLILTGAIGGEGITQFTPGSYHNG